LELELIIFMYVRKKEKKIIYQNKKIIFFHIFLRFRLYAPFFLKKSQGSQILHL